jgi:hypothetical protein
LKTYEEQPFISYNGEMMMLVREKNDIMSYSTISNLNLVLTNNPTHPMIETTMVDINSDDKNEYFVGQITFPSKAVEVQDIQLFLIFNYGLRVIFFFGHF